MDAAHTEGVGGSSCGVRKQPPSAFDREICADQRRLAAGLQLAGPLRNYLQ